MQPGFYNAIEDALDNYAKAVPDTATTQDYADIIVIAQRLIDALKAGNIAQAKFDAVVFSRRASDSLAIQPEEFKSLSRLVHDVSRVTE